MKIVTWNVNGIRARQGELQDLLAAEQPDVVCLQEIKASPEQIPGLLRRARGLLVLLARRRRLLGGRAARAVRFRTRRDPQFTHPAFDMEHRIVVADLGRMLMASVYVPNGGKDYDAKMAFLDGLAGWAAETNAAGRTLVICGDLNVAREERDVHPKERKPNQIGTRPEERALLARLLDARARRRRPHARSRQRRALHLVGAVAQPAAAQHRLADRLRAGERRARRAGRGRRRRGASSARAITRRVVVTFHS